MKTPVSYYGGKQKMVKHLLELIPKHHLYCEPFFGGGALFFAKPVSEVEVINDVNHELMNFYRVLQLQFNELQKEIRATLHARTAHAQAVLINSTPEFFNPVQRAWAIWVLAAQSFCSKLNGAWGYDVKKNSTSRKVAAKRQIFTSDLHKRMELVQLECNDAIRVIETRDSSTSFFYVDPPYYNSDCGHYSGYTIKDFESLLKTLSKIKGKFLLSSYPSDMLCAYTKKHKWFTKSVKSAVSVNHKASKGKIKTEVMTGNYRL